MTERKTEDWLPYEYAIGSQDRRGMTILRRGGMVPRARWKDSPPAVITDSSWKLYATLEPCVDREEAIGIVKRLTDAVPKEPVGYDTELARLRRAIAWWGNSYWNAISGGPLRDRIVEIMDEAAKCGDFLDAPYRVADVIIAALDAANSDGHAALQYVHETGLTEWDITFPEGQYTAQEFVDGTE